MKKIGITQRVQWVESYGERRDCIDQNWANLLINLGYTPIILPNLKDKNATQRYIQDLNLDGIILSGGNDLGWTKSSKAVLSRDEFEMQIIEIMIRNVKPILGICRGMQLINLFFGGQLVKIKNHVCSDHKITTTNGRVYQVNSYHDWGITRDILAKNLIPLAYAEDAIVEYCEHDELPITGIMWHPERNNIDQDFGRSIIQKTFL